MTFAERAAAYFEAVRTEPHPYSEASLFALRVLAQDPFWPAAFDELINQIIASYQDIIRTYGASPAATAVQSDLKLLAFASEPLVLGGNSALTQIIAGWRDADVPLPPPPPKPPIQVSSNTNTDEPARTAALERALKIDDALWPKYPGSGDPTYPPGFFGELED